MLSGPMLLCSRSARHRRLIWLRLSSGRLTGPSRRSFRQSPCLQVSPDTCMSMSQAIDFREKLMGAIEKQGASMALHGETEQWFGDAAPHIRRVAHDFNGPLFTKLVRLARHPDAECAELLRKGGRLSGTLERLVGVFRLPLTRHGCTISVPGRAMALQWSPRQSNQRFFGSTAT